jgi:hypothetical protein
MLLSPVRSEVVREAVRRIVDRKQRIIAMIPTSTASILNPAESDSILVAVTKDLILLQRENALKFLQTYNVPTIEWDPKSPISKTLEVLEKWTSREPIASLQTH